MRVFSRLVVTTLPLVPKLIVGKVASRYVAGSTLEEALGTVERLNGDGAMATLDILGEEVRDVDRAQAAVEGYLSLYRAIADRGLDANVSVKPTMLGLKIDAAVFKGHIARLAQAAKKRGNFLRLDMEDRTTTDRTLETYRELHPRFPDIGVVLQAYMRRTLRDIDELPAEGANVRLCKGIYIEPRKDSFKGYETIRLNFLAALEKLLRRGAYVGIATHDEHLVCGALGLIDRLGVDRDRYEFQMLLGVDRTLRRILLDEGHRLRVYVPFGPDWYHYSMRRLRENPEVARHVIRAMLPWNRETS